MKRNYFLTFLLLFVTFAIFAQSGEVSGKIVDENGQAIPFANISIVENGKPTGTGSTTDFDGFYSVKPLSAGRYDIKFSYIGYTSVIKAGVLVKNDQTTLLDQKLSPSALKVEEVVVIRYKIPLIDAGATSTQNTVTSEDIQNLATRSVTDIASTTAGVTKSSNGDIHMRGSRGNSVVYYVDGIRVNGSPNIPVSAIEQLDVITGGVPAKYGEATGGVINVSTKGARKKFAGGIEVLESLDQWRYDLVNLNIAGPILKDKAKEKTVLGFALSGEYKYQLDRSPSAVEMWKLKDGVLDSLQKSPLYRDGDNIRWNAERITFDDMEKTQINPNVKQHDANLNLKFDLMLSDDMKLTMGGSGDFFFNHRRIDRYALFNYENNPEESAVNYRGYLKFTHNIRKKENENGKPVAKGIFQNGFYTAIVSYEKFITKSEDDTHRDKSFAYGYMGSFKTERDQVYDTESGYYNLINYTDKHVSFKPSDVNKNGANFTEQYYQLLGAVKNDEGYYVVPEENIASRELTKSVDILSASPALVNGKRAETPHGLWYNTGRQWNGHGETNGDQINISLSGGFDILKAGAESRNKHSISLGFSFEQRNYRSYTVVGPLSLWDLAKRNVNTHLQLNQDVGYVYSNGDSTLIDETTKLYLTDTVVHNYYHGTDPNGTKLEQSTFDERLREKLGITNNEFIDLMSLPYETFSKDMFSEDELLNSGNTQVIYRGYDIYGNINNDNVSFLDFWNKVDENGKHTRPIGALKPTYMSGYIEDKFQLKDLTFRVGLRIDQFNANTMVLKDKYSITGSQTVGEAIDIVEGLKTKPDNIKDDFIVYVDKQESPKVLGYRKGDIWYGKEGQVIANFTAMGGAPEPLMPEGQIANTRSSQFKPELAFKDYEAEWNFMPRLQFSFNISDNALFFAHYDILSQSPQANDVSPLDYFYYNGGFINNPNIRSETTTDFQLGFKQKLNKTSAFTFSAYFKEFKDQIQTVRVDGVFPNPSIYYTLENVDFGNTKGFEFGYEMRRTNNLKLNVNYTLQFADGTGSDKETQEAVVRASTEKFRDVNSLDFDSRHNVNIVIDYRFGEGDEYDGPTTKKGAQILSNFGVNLLTQLHSGTPYTKKSLATSRRAISPTSSTSEGLLNAYRLGMILDMDLKINKSFDIKLKSKKEGAEDTKLSFDVYLRVDNILGIKNVTKVYKYTGSASDDGWLGSPQGRVVINNAFNKQSYIDLYKAGLNDQANYAIPRRVFIGASVNF